jgi:DNA polymerase III subunit beta
MKFSCERDVIMKEIAIATEIISSRNSLSILSNVLLKAENNTLQIRATDLKVSFETVIPVEVQTPGATTVYCDKVLGILRTVPSGEIEFEQDTPDKVIIRPRFKKVDFRLKCIEADRFPEIQLVPQESYWEIPQKEFIEMISQTVFAVSDDETRYFMNGVYMENNGGSLVMVATDGRRLSFISKDISPDLPEFSGVIIPPKILNLVRKLASGEGNFSLAVGEKNLFVQFENQKISSALIEGQFPNYRRVIPEKQEHSLLVSREDMSEALKRVSLLVEKSRRVYLNLAGNSIVLKSEEGEIGAAEEELSCEYTGPEVMIALNYTYLTEPLKVIESEMLSIQFTEPNKALTIYPVPETDYFHIVMPMQLD